MQAEELHLLALEDFKHALAHEGLRQALSTLQSYLQELHGAPEDTLLELAAAFRRHAVVAVLGSGGVRQALDDLRQLQELLSKVVASSRAAVQEVHSAWQDATMSLLYGRQDESAGAAAARVHSLADTLPMLLSSMQQLSLLPAPATHQQRRSMLMCLLHLQLFPADGLPAGALHDLISHAAPPWFGRDVTHARQQQAAAFEAFAAIIQHVACIRNPLSPAQHLAALDFLKLFRPPLPAITDLWWAHFAALLHGLVQQAADRGMAALRQPALQALARGLCCQETAHMVVPLVLAHPEYMPRPEHATAGGRKKGGGGGRGAGTPTKRALAMAACLLAHDVPAFLAGCCELLRPEANCALQTRVEALAAMDRAAGSYLEGQERKPDGAALRLWPPAALDQLLCVLRSDPSVKARREAMRVLSSVAVEVGSPQEALVLRAVVLRCRDKDEVVRKEAFDMLAQFPHASLERLLSLSDWQALLDTGLAGPLPGQGSDTRGVGPSKSAAKHAAAVYDTAVQLLSRYLGMVKEDCGMAEAAGSDGSRQKEAEKEEEEEARGCSCMDQDEAPSSSSSIRNDKLQGLQPPEAGSCALAAHLRAAWDKALREMAGAEKLMAHGATPIDGSGAGSDLDWE